jgi:Zn-finger nucleic acid-binding protein
VPSQEDSEPATYDISYQNGENEMKCPVDGSELETCTLQSVAIEECAQCQGLWFEHGELRKVKDEMVPDAIWLDFDLWSDQAAFDVGWSERKCPECGKKMAIISYGETGENVDYCVDEHGVWLDKGELEAIVKALEVEINTKGVSEYAAASVAAALEIVTGDEGIISEWKDFLSVIRLLQYRVLSENPKMAEALQAFQTTQPVR